MVDLLKVTLVNGIPVTGNGDVATINALMADGGLATIGNKTDPATTVTTSAAATGIGIWKQISKSVQSLLALWPTALGAGGGVKVDGSGTPLPVALAAVPPHDVSNNGQFSVQLSSGRSVAVSITCGTTGYVPSDVIGPAGALATLAFNGIAPAVASDVEIVSATLEIDRAAIAGEGGFYRLYVFNSPPPSALNDSATWSFQAGDRASFLGFLDLPRNDLGPTQWCEVNNVGKQVKALGSTLYGYLCTMGTFVPIAAVHKVTLHTRTV